jgi:hypothetical protein
LYLFKTRSIIGPTTKPLLSTNISGHLFKFCALTFFGLKPACQS